VLAAAASYEREARQSSRLVIGAPWSPFAGERQRSPHPPRLDISADAGRQSAGRRPPTPTQVRPPTNRRGISVTGSVLIMIISSVFSNRVWSLREATRRPPGLLHQSGLTAGLCTGAMIVNLVGSCIVRAGSPPAVAPAPRRRAGPAGRPLAGPQRRRRRPRRPPPRGGVLAAGAGGACSHAVMSLCPPPFVSGCRGGVGTFNQMAVWLPHSHAILIPSVLEAPWLRFTSECQRCRHPRYRNAPPCLTVNLV
jgi:hypothetical protein